MKHGLLAILGIDAGDPDFIQRWTQEGYLPTIETGTGVNPSRNG
jgi:hypothetical protein